MPIALQKQNEVATTDHPYLRCDWIPNSKTTYNVDGIGGQKGPVSFQINPFGFRSSSMKTAQKPAGTTRIFFLGGSTTECVILPEEKTFPYLVEKKLSEAFPNKHFECINSGMSGTLAADMLATLIYKVMYYEPDIIFYMQAVNDLRYGAFPSYDPVNRPDYRRKSGHSNLSEEAKELLRKILKQSRFLTLIKWRIINRFFPPESERLKTKMDEYNESRKLRRDTPFTEVSESKSLEDYVKYLKEMIYICKGHNIRLILMTEPFIYQKETPGEIDKNLWMGYFPKHGINLSNKFLSDEMNRFNGAVRQLAKEYNVELIDLEKEIPKNLTYFYDDVHFTPQGTYLVAKIIGNYLTEHLDNSSG